MLTQHFAPKSAKLQNIGKNDPSSGVCTPHRGIIFLSQILILVSSISYLFMVKKAKWFSDTKKFNFFKNNNFENFKNLEILWSKRYFFNFLQVITFDTFMVAN